MSKKKPFLGHAIIDKQMIFTSVSQIKTFDPDSDGCPRKWAFSYRFGKKLERTDALKDGSSYAEQLEHYLKTGEDVLSPVLQPLKKYLMEPGTDLELEEPLAPDIEKAISLRKALLKAPGDHWPKLLIDEIQKFAGLVAAGVPVEGAADVRHVRGKYVDQNGLLRDEPKGTVVVEIGDLKTVTRIYPQMIQKGENRGKMLPAYTLTDAEVCEDTQMIGYARHGVWKYPTVTHVRLSHWYVNKWKREAVKRTGLISVERVLERWDRVEGKVRKMQEVAKAERIEDVEPNTAACDSFTHVDPNDPSKTLKGCGHRYYCPLHISQSLMTMVGRYEESAMSLFDTTSPAAPPATNGAPPPPMDPAAHAAAVAAAKERMLKEDAAASVGVQAAPPQLAKDQIDGYYPGQPCNGFGYYANGNGKGYIRVEPGHSCPVCVATQAQVVTAPAAQVAPVAPPVASPVAPPVAPPVVFSPIAVNPPDQPPVVDPLKAAAPVPQSQIAQIEDPVLRAQVETHAQQHAQLALEEAERERLEKGATSVWCPQGAMKIVISSEVAVNRKWTCQCGKSYTLTQLKPIKEADQFVSVIPRHKPPKKGEAEAAAASGVPVAAVAAPVVTASAVPVATPAVVAPAVVAPTAPAVVAPAAPVAAAAPAVVVPAAPVAAAVPAVVAPAAPVAAAAPAVAHPGLIASTMKPNDFSFFVVTAATGEAFVVIAPAIKWVFDLIIARNIAATKIEKLNAQVLA